MALSLKRVKKLQEVIQRHDINLFLDIFLGFVGIIGEFLLAILQITSDQY